MKTNKFSSGRVSVAGEGHDFETEKSFIEANLLHVEPPAFVKVRAGEAAGLLKKMHKTNAKSRLINMPSRARFAYSDEGSRPNSAAASSRSRK